MTAAQRRAVVRRQEPRQLGQLEDNCQPVEIDFLRRALTVEATTNEVEGRFVEGSGKTKNSVRTFSVPQLVLDELAAHLARTGRTATGDRVVQAPNGGPVRATNFRLRVYNPAIAKAGLKGLTFHRLRHSAGHMMREGGVPLEVIQRRLGHASIRTTADIYGRPLRTSTVVWRPSSTTCSGTPVVQMWCRGALLNEVQLAHPH